MKFTVLSLNMWMGNYLDRVIGLIEDVDPDIMMFQEVTSGPKIHLTLGVANAHEQIEQQVDGDSIFSSIWKINHDIGDYYVGISIYSKHKFKKSVGNCYFGNLDTLSQEETSDKNDFPGVVTSCVLVFGDVEIEFMTTHFIWSLFPEVSVRQMSAVRELVKLVKSKDNLIFGGDFNVTRDSEVYKNLAAVLVDDMKDVEDSTLDPVIHRAGGKNLAVDFMFHKGVNIKKLSAKVVDKHVSDHRAILVEYKVDK